MKLSESQLYQLLVHTGNLRALHFQLVEPLTETPSQPQVAATDTPKVLKKLEFLQFQDGSIPAKDFSDIVPDSLKILDMGWIDEGDSRTRSVENDWTEAQRYLAKQKQLKKLCFSFFLIEEFRFDPHLNQVESLVMYRNCFRTPSAFQVRFPIEILQFKLRISRY